MSNISYNTASQPTQIKVGPVGTNQVTENYSFDAQTGLLTGQTVKNTAATQTFLDLTYTYSRGNSAGSANGKTGQMTKIVDNLDRNRDRLYEFDTLGRLSNAKGGLAAGATGVTANWTQSYAYDRYGNKTGVSASGVDQNSASIPADGLTSVSVDAATNRMTTASGWIYDLAGNLIRGQNASGVWQRFEYDAAGRLKKVKDDSNNVIETYTYGATRERLITETTAGRTYYVWGGSSVVCEYTETATTPAYNKGYVYAGSRLLMTATKASSTTETKEFHHPDRLGTKLVTNGGAGTYYQQSTLPFGTALNAESSGFSNQVFTSYDRSAATGLDYAVNRTYSPGQSRFTQVDPIGMASASLGVPQSLNMYAYVQNMPTDFVDPSGLNASPGYVVCFPDRYEGTGRSVAVYRLLFTLAV
jgi:RHS repeat-associated protein